MANKASSRTPFWIELPILVLVALVVAVVIKSFLVQAFFIPSGSMRHTLEIGDRVLVNKLSYTWSDPALGDIVVFEPPWGQPQQDEPVFDALARHVAESLGLRSPDIEDLIKRVIGVGGQTVEVRHNQVLIDGEPIAEPYVFPGTQMPDYGPLTVPEGQVLVMGDNRDHSKDGRVFGPIPVSSIVGRAFVRIWPLGRLGGL